MKSSIVYGVLSMFLILCACAVPAMAFAGPYTDAQRLGAVGVPAGLAVVLWALRDAREALARWRVEGEMRRAEEERQERRERRARMAALKAERAALGDVCWRSDHGSNARCNAVARMDQLSTMMATLEGQIAADEARERMVQEEAGP